MTNKVIYDNIVQKRNQNKRPGRFFYKEINQSLKDVSVCQTLDSNLFLVINYKRLKLIQRKVIFAVTSQKGAFLEIFTTFGTALQTSRVIKIEKKERTRRFIFRQGPRLIITKHTTKWDTFDSNRKILKNLMKIMKK